MDKLKEILGSKKAQIVEFVALGISAAALFIGGESEAAVSGVVASVAGAVAGLGAVVALIRAIVNKTDTKE